MPATSKNLAHSVQKLLFATLLASLHATLDHLDLLMVEQVPQSSVHDIKGYHMFAYGTYESAMIL